MSVNLVVLKRLGIAGMIFSISVGEKCDVVLFVGTEFVYQVVCVIVCVARPKGRGRFVYWVGIIF